MLWRLRDWRAFCFIDEVTSYQMKQNETTRNKTRRRDNDRNKTKRNDTRLHEITTATITTDRCSYSYTTPIFSQHVKTYSSSPWWWWCAWLGFITLLFTCGKDKIRTWCCLLAVNTGHAPHVWSHRHVVGNLVVIDSHQSACVVLYVERTGDLVDVTTWIDAVERVDLTVSRRDETTRCILSMLSINWWEIIVGLRDPYRSWAATTSRSQCYRWHQRILSL